MHAPHCQSTASQRSQFAVASCSTPSQPRTFAAPAHARHQQQPQASRRGQAVVPLAALTTPAVTVQQGLEAWLESKQLDLTKQLVTVVDGLLVCTRDIKKGETIYAVPDSLWITPAVVQASAIGSHVADLELWAQLALFLVQERAAQDSPWVNYIASLPSQPGTPVFWSDEELQGLAGTQLLGSTLAYRCLS